jgi:hypothetical protein
MKNYLDVKFFLLLFFEVIIDVIQGFLLKVLHPLFVCSGVVYVQVLLFEVDAFSIGFFGVNGQLPKTIYQVILEVSLAKFFQKNNQSLFDSHFGFTGEFIGSDDDGQVVPAGVKYSLLVHGHVMRPRAFFGLNLVPL